jgi:hypothetical protein
MKNRLKDAMNATYGPLPEPTRVLGCDFLALDALLCDLEEEIEDATGDELSALNFRYDALKRVLAFLRDVARSQSDVSEK